MIQTYYNHRTIKLSEMQIGNVFTLGPADQVVITGIHLSGKVQIANRNNHEIEEVEYQKLSPYCLPASCNTDILVYELKDTGFEQKENGLFEMFVDGGKSILRQRIFKNDWIISYENKDINISYPIQFMHELQNIFLLITKSKLSFK